MADVKWSKGWAQEMAKGTGITREVIDRTGLHDLVGMRKYELETAKKWVSAWQCFIEHYSKGEKFCLGNQSKGRQFKIQAEEHVFVAQLRLKQAENSLSWASYPG